MKKTVNLKTQEEYDTILRHLENKGYKWMSEDLPTSKDYWKTPDFCLVIRENKYLTHTQFLENDAIYFNEFMKCEFGYLPKPWDFIQTSDGEYFVIVEHRGELWTLKKDPEDGKLKNGGMLASKKVVNAWRNEEIMEDRLDIIFALNFDHKKVITFWEKVFEDDPDVAVVIKKSLWEKIKRGECS